MMSISTAFEESSVPIFVPSAPIIHKVSSKTDNLNVRNAAPSISDLLQEKVGFVVAKNQSRQAPYGRPARTIIGIEHSS